MKIKITLSLLLFIGTLMVNAQSTPNKITLNENAVVRAEDGLVYPYATWRKMMSTGKYGLKKRQTFTDSGKPEYLIYKLSDAQKEDYFEQMAKPRGSESFKEGEDFNGFKTTDINGNKFDLKDARGKVIVLNFWFINCPPCKQEIPQLNELVAEYKDKPEVVFLAVATDEKYALKNFLESTPYQYNIVSGKNIAFRFNVKLYPTHVVIDKTGKIKFSTVGLASNTIYWIKKSINESLAAN